MKVYVEHLNLWIIEDYRVHNFGLLAYHFSYMEVSGLYPWKGLSSHLINMAMICPITANMPTTTFHPRRYFGPGLNFEMTWPDIRKPRHIARMAAGPVVEKVGTYISISDVQGGQIRTILSRKN